MTNLETANLFLEWFAQNYDTLNLKYRKFCSNKRYVFDEDIFSGLPLKIYDIIIRNGLADTSDSGFDGYCFKAFKNNLLSEKRYSRIKKRDCNKTDQEINGLYEVWYNSNNTSSEEKLKSDLFKDFATLYILLLVESNFDEEHYYLFKLKMLCNLTFKDLQQRSGVQYSRKKYLEVASWLRDNLKKSDIRKAFEEQFSEIID